jgi:hypothetical protein
MDLSGPLRNTAAFTEKLLNSIRINKIIRKIRKVVPTISNTLLKALAVNSRIFTGWIRPDIWSWRIFKPFSFRYWINELLIFVRVDSKFERLLEKDDNVSHNRKATPEKSINDPSITIISASHLGILFFSSQEIGCAQIILMKSASKKGVMIDFA